MNIVWIPNFLPFPADNGGKVVTSNRMKYVAQKHTIIMITEAEAQPRSAAEDMAQIVSEARLIKPVRRSPLYLTKWLVKASLNVGRYWNPGITQAIKDVLQKQTVDVINIDLPMPYINLYPLQKELQNIPVVINQQNIEFHNVRSKSQADGVHPLMKLYARIESARLLRWERTLYRQPSVRAVSFLSKPDQALFTQVFGLRDGQEYFFSPIGTTPPAHQSKAIAHEGRMIVMPASFSYPPNIHGAVWFAQNVMPVIRKQAADVKLYLVGSNPAPAVRELQCDDIIVTGTVAQMEPYMEAADIFVVPIFFGGGVKTKLIEMGCYAKPVISTSQGSAGTLYKDNEDLLIADDPAPFAAACVAALENPGQYTDMCQAMLHKTRTHYLWDQIGAQYCKAIEEICHRAAK